MIVAQQMQHAVRGQEAELPLQAVSVFLRLFPGSRQADYNITQTNGIGIRIPRRLL